MRTTFHFSKSLALVVLAGSIVIAAVTATAQTSSEDLNAQLAAEVGVAEGRVRALTADVLRAEREVNVYRRKHNCDFGGYITGECWKDYPELTTAKNTLEARKAELEQARVHAERANAEAASARARVRSGDYQAQFVAVEGEMSAMRSSYRIERQWSQVEDLNSRLDNMIYKRDQGLLGAYVKDKMTDLLNSDAFCKIAHQCPTMRAAPNALDSIFFNTATRTRPKRASASEDTAE